MGGLQPWHWVIVIAVFVLLFGAKKLPDAARSLGQSMRIFKSEVKEMKRQAGGREACDPDRIGASRNPRTAIRTHRQAPSLSPRRSSAASLPRRLSVLIHP